MKNKLIKILSAALICMSFSSFPAMAQSTLTLNDVIEKVDQQKKDNEESHVRRARSLAEAISSLDVLAYGIDVNGTGSGWNGDSITQIKRDKLEDLWCVTYQKGYGSIDYVKVDGKNIKYDYTKYPQGSGSISSWKQLILLQDNDFIKNLSNGNHTVEIRMSSPSNIYPGNSCVTKYKFTIID